MKRNDLDNLEQRLRETPRLPEVSSGLHDRIMAGVRAARPLPRQPAFSPALVAALVVAALASLFWLIPGGKPDSPARPLLALPSFEAVPSLPLAVTPLDREAAAIRADVTSAGSYLLACAGLE